MTRRDWRSAASYRDLEDLSLRDFAWEYLRRNPHYIEDHARVASSSDADKTAHHWGLRFRGRPQHQRRASKRSVARHARSQRPLYVRLAAGLGLATASTLVGCCIIADVR